MAYNPFNIFRRNQKALFAVLTVFIMFMFTLSFGAGDFFDRIPRWLGARRGEVLCKIDGSKVTAGELEGSANSLKYKRVMANRFMALAAEETIRNLEVAISEQMPRLSEEGSQTAFQALQISNMLRRQPFSPDMAQGLAFLANDLTKKIESPTAKTEDKEVARAAQAMYLLMSRSAGGGQYFTNAPNRTQRDLIEFLLWEKKADQLGIRFTRNDVNKLIQNEFSGYFRSDVNVRKQMASQQGFTMDACLDAIATEFKVRAAQTALLGYPGRFHGAPALTTPYELFEFYRDQTSPSTYEVLSVPAVAFLDKVTAEPTEAELQDLYKKYANDDPNPKSETPGFKDPRKISVAFIGITGEEPYYKKLAEEQLKVGETMAKASGLLATPLPGALGTWAAAAVAPMSLKEPAVDAAYTRYADEFKFELSFKYRSANLTARDLLPSSTVRPSVIAATLGGTVGQAAGFGSPIAATAISMTAAIRAEIHDRVKVGMPLVLGGIPGPALLPTAIMGTAAAVASEPKPLPIEAKRADLMKETIDKRAKVLAFGERPPGFGAPPNPALEKGDVQRFIEDLGKLNENGKPKDKAASDKFVQEFIKTRGLTHSGASTAPRDEWTLEDDPGLLPLVIAQKDSVRMAQSAHGGEYMPFGRSFFWTSDFDRATFRRVRGPATTGLYLGQTYPPGDPTSRDDGRPHYIVWRTEDIPSRKTTFVAAEPFVRAAWKRMKAREMAQAHAEALANTIRANPTQDEFFLHRLMQDLQLTIRDFKASSRARVFTIRGVAPRAPGMLGAMGPLQQFTVSESEDIPFPTPEMATALLENRDKPLKTVLVLPDAPKDTFYVAVLTKRDLKQPLEFRQDVFSRTGPAREMQFLFRDEAMMKSRQSVVELLKKEFRYEETEEQKKKLDENEKSGGRGGD